MDEKILLKIEAYLSETMSDNERTAFKKDIEKDPSLKKEVQLAKQLNLFLSENSVKEKVTENEFSERITEELKSEEAKQLKETLKKAQLNYNIKVKKKPTKRPFILLAASVALLLATAWVLFFNKTVNSDELFAEYYQANDLPAVIKRDGNPSLFEQGVIQFSKNDFKEAQHLFQDYLKTSKEINPSVYIYSGITNWELGNNEKAIAAFDKMITSNSIDASKGLWFKALFYLKTNDKEKAKQTLLQLIENKENFNYQKANEILKKL